MGQIKVLKNIMNANENMVSVNRDIFAQQHILTIDLMSSPGAGKTTILEKTIDNLKSRLGMGVIEGDLMTSKDAERIHRHGIPVVQINTEGGCHLDANMVNHAIKEFDLNELDLMVIENVGNLVCPAAFNLGEAYKVVVLSVAEGEDKPLKYPVPFQQAKACLLNKIDLLPYCSFDLEAFERDMRSLNPDIVMFHLSATNNQGIEEWCKWLLEEVKRVKQN
jgi:hydrogenase nickel incorporation protein HypB